MGLWGEEVAGRILKFPDGRRGIFRREVGRWLMEKKGTFDDLKSLVLRRRVERGWGRWRKTEQLRQRTTLLGGKGVGAKA